MLRIYLYCLYVNLFISYFWVVYPIGCMILQKLPKIYANSWVRKNFMHHDVVVLILVFSLNLLEISHGQTPFFWAFIRYLIHKISICFTKIFRYIFSISLKKLITSFWCFLKKTKFFISISLNIGSILVVRLIGVSTILAWRYKRSFL